MSRSNIHLLDLPDEILLNILKKLDNIDVLYSLFGINNQRLENIIQHESFSNILNIASMTQNTTIIHSILNRFCNDIIPRIAFNVKCLILEAKYMEHFLLTTYPNLTQLKISDLEGDHSLKYFTDDSPIGNILKHQITKLDIIYNPKDGFGSSKARTKIVYGHILTYCEQLQRLNITSPSGFGYLGLSLRYLPSDVFSSSTLTYLCINVQTFVDFVYLLDGRVKNLNTLIIQIYSMEMDSSVNHHLNDLPNLKCFSLVHYYMIKENYNEILLHLHRMRNLEKLTLYLRLVSETTFLDPVYLLNQFRIHMSKLNSFNFYLSTENKKNDFIHYLSNNNDIKQNYINRGNQQILNFHQNIDNTVVYHIFTLPFQFTRLEYIGNNFANVTFNYVIHLTVYDEIPFEYEFFLRLSKAFPKLRKLCVFNSRPWSYDAHIIFDNVIQSPNEIVEYPHLNYLDITRTNVLYIEQLLNETKTYLPCLTELKVLYEELRFITQDFTRERTRRNCVNVKRLVFNHTIVGSKDYYSYFPLL